MNEDSTKMKLRFIIIPISILLLISAQVHCAGIREKAEIRIKKKLGTEKIKFEKFIIDSNIKSEIEKEIRQNFFGNFIYKWEIYKENKLTNILLLDNVYGKTMPISFFVIFNLDGKIVDVEIVKYRESHGGQVQNKNWLNQFNGKDKDSNYKIGEDIDGISGATISVNSVSKGILKLSKLFNRIYKNEIN